MCSKQTKNKTNLISFPIKILARHFFPARLNAALFTAMFISLQQKSFKSLARLSVSGGGEPGTVQHEEKQPDELITVQKAICRLYVQNYHHNINISFCNIRFIVCMLSLLQSFEL